MPDTPLFIGLMSGTSVDGVDAVLVDFSQTIPNIVAHSETAIPSGLREEILILSQPGDDHVDRLGHCDHSVGELFASATQQLLQESDTRPEQICAIGSHGQTIRHRPPQRGEQRPFSLQIGDPNIIAARTGITTVADFRRRDVALGGQGAPLVPAFHADAFGDNTANRAVLNLGGIANVSWLPREGEALGFDTGPANILMDAWCQLHQGQPYDKDGAWAAGGTVQLELLKRLMAHPFMAQAAPKSTGREAFNLDWLKRVLSELGNSPSPQDVQATLLELTARSAAEAIKNIGKANDVYLCGGGALNKQLVTRLKSLLHPATVTTTSTLGIDPKLVEAVAFAWLAKRTLERLPGNLPAVTGASQSAILGGVYFS